MLRRIDWILGFLLHIPVMFLLMRIPLKSRSLESPIPPVIIQLTHQIPEREEVLDSTAMVETLQPEINPLPSPGNSLSNPDSLSYAPSIENSDSGVEWDFHGESGIIDLEIPDPFFEDDFWESEAFIENSPEQEMARYTGGPGFSLDWIQGGEREIQYIPLWDDVLEKELSQGELSIHFSFKVTSQGYVDHVELDDDITINTAWKDLLINWISRLVFEPGDESTANLVIMVSE